MLDVFERRFHSATLEVVLSTDSCIMKRRTSSVWSHFAQPDDERKLQCQHCDARLSYVGGTTVMLNHLKLRHPELVETEKGLPAQRQLSLSEAFCGRPFTADKSAVDKYAA